MTALKPACAKNDLVNVALGRPERAQGCELVDVVLGARIERLRDDDGADQRAKQRAADQRQASAGFEQPLLQAAGAEFFLRQNVS